MNKTTADKIPRFFYLGLYLISFCLLAFEIILTRILSVILWYHFAFLVVSVALFGMTAGTIIVYLAPRFFLPKLTITHIRLFAYASSFAIVFSLFSLFYLPAILHHLNAAYLLMPALYLCLALPFITIGICLSLSLTRFPAYIGKLYSVNLIGSALGCIGVIFLLNNLNAASALLILAGLCAVSTLFFSAGENSKKIRAYLYVATAVLFTMISLENKYSNFIKPLWVKGQLNNITVFYEKWNFFSYVSVNLPSRRPFGWGFSPNISSEKINTQELMLTIDNGAGTVLTKFNSLKDIEYLKLDISAIAYYLRNNDDVLVLGSGGGRDLLTAALFGAKKATGVEINSDLKDIAFNKFKFFSGNILKIPQIRIVVDEGRSFASKSKNSYDKIQVSLVDSFAASANGAFALSENSLYTKEGWSIFLSRLKDNGILTFSRYYIMDNPREIYRLITLAKSALQAIGIKNPSGHISLARYFYPDSNIGIGTILVSKTPFTPEEMTVLEKTCEDLKFEVALSPYHCLDNKFKLLLEEKQNSYNTSDFKANISAPTDDKPFFFYFSRFKNFFSETDPTEGISVLRKVFFMILLFGITCILIPIFCGPKAMGFGKVSAAMSIYFLAIGIGFMLIEIPLIQKLGMFLGRPIYGLTVVLFSLLVSCGAGSYLTKYLINISEKKSIFSSNKAKISASFLFLLALILANTYILPAIVKLSESRCMPEKIAIAISALATLGLFMGMPFPLAMSIIGKNESSPGLLYWGINGFASVCGSALGLALLINSGFQTALLISFFCYLIAFLALLPNLKLLETP